MADRMLYDDFEKPGLEGMKLACDVLLRETDAIPDTLEVELTLFRERVERALLLHADGRVTRAGTGRASGDHA